MHKLTHRGGDAQRLVKLSRCQRVEIRLFALLQFPRSDVAMQLVLQLFVKQIPRLLKIASTNRTCVGAHKGIDDAPRIPFLNLSGQRIIRRGQFLRALPKGGGLLLFPNTYQEIQQIKATPFVVDADQMKAIKDNVYQYFGVNEDILTNKFNADTWSAFYEGAIEPFAVQFSEVMTKMLFTIREQTQGNLVIATSNRIQYMSNADKLAVSAQMADRGLMTRNEIREIWNLAPLPEPIGSQLPIRGEYYNVGESEETNDDEGNQSI